VIDWIAEIEADAEPGALDAVTEDWLARKADQAEAMIAVLFPQVAARLQSGKLPHAAYRAVVCAMVIRVARNPGGLQSEADGVYQYTRAANGGSADLWLTANEKAILLGPTATTGLTVGTINIDSDRGWGR